MTQDRHIDIKIADPERTASFNYSQSLYSFTTNLGKFKQVLYEEENVLVLSFDRGEVRLEISPVLKLHLLDRVEEDEEVEVEVVLVPVLVLVRVLEVADNEVSKNTP